ncbi:MAG: hypothetical protein K2Y20_05425 [Sphingomonas sp.]|nr:hypothetical protein [Sphingomonas sp.]
MITDERAAPPLPLELIATDALLAELKRRTEPNGVALEDAIARAETAEAKLAQAMAALTGTAHG